MASMQQPFTAALEGLTRQNTDLQAELANRRQRAANEIVAFRQEVRALLGGSLDIHRCGHKALAKNKRHLRASGGLAELGRNLQGMCWRSRAQAAASGVRVCEDDDADCHRHDVG